MPAGRRSRASRCGSTRTARRSSRTTTTTKAFYSFMLWDNVLINGQARQAGLQNLLVPESRDRKALSGRWAASWPQLAYPAVVADEKQVNPNAKADEAWGWLPPPLVGEGTQGADRLAARLPARSVPDSSGRRAADAEVQHVAGRGHASWSITSRRSTASTIPTTSIRARASRIWPPPKPSIRIGWTTR